MYWNMSCEFYFVVNVNNQRGLGSKWLASMLDCHLVDPTWLRVPPCISAELKKKVKFIWAPRSAQPKMDARKNVLQKWRWLAGLWPPNECWLVYKIMLASTMPNGNKVWKGPFACLLVYFWLIVTDYGVCNFSFGCLFFFFKISQTCIL